MNSSGPTPADGVAPIAAIVLTYNEERNLDDCLRSLAGWTRQLFVVDSGSTDRTIEIARSYGAEVYSHPFEHYGAQRNWALDSLPIATPWILNVDADERITPELRDSIVAAIANDDSAVDGYLVTRRTVFMGRWIRHGGHYPAWHLRLFRTGRGRCEDRLYDQHFTTGGAVAHLRGDMIDTLTPNISTFTVRHVRWAALEAEEQEAKGGEEGRVVGRAFGSAIERRRWLRERYGRLPLFVRPALYFLYRYFVRLGVLDGVEGLIFHFLQGFWYRFMTDALIYERRVAAKRSAAVAARAEPAVPVGRGTPLP